MGTYCSIAIRNSDCTVTSIVASNNGFTSYMAEVLLNHYQDPERIRQVLSVGNISHLVEDVDAYNVKGFSIENTPAIVHKNFQEYCNWLNGFLLHNYFMDTDGRWLYIEREKNAVLLKTKLPVYVKNLKRKLIKDSVTRIGYAISVAFYSIVRELGTLVKILRNEYGNN